MFSLIRTLGLELALRREAAPFIVAFLIAELFYKFHSFALECLGFLATWFVLSALQAAALKLLRRDAGGPVP